MNTRFLCLALTALLLLPASLTGCRPASGTDTTDPAVPHVVASDPVAAGRYLITVGGCNDCHTPGYAESGGALAESEWLVGSPVGWRGPWGTTYPSNLRLTTQTLSEDAFVEVLRTRKALPPMPWAAVNQLSEPDARAIYRFIHSLGPKGEAMPASVPPDVEPATPYLELTPQHMERLATHTPAAAPGT